MANMSIVNERGIQVHGQSALSMQKCFAAVFEHQGPALKYEVLRTRRDGCGFMQQTMICSKARIALHETKNNTKRRVLIMPTKGTHHPI